MAGRCTFVALIALLAVSQTSSMYSPSLGLRTSVALRSEPSKALRALRLRGGADLAPEINVGEEAQAAATAAGAADAAGGKRCPHGVPMDSAEECHRCEVLAFMQRSAFVLQKTNGTANSTHFAQLWGECFPMLPVMTPEASRTSVAQALNATGYFDVVPIPGSEDKQFTFNEKATKMCPHGVPLDSSQRCMLCEKISFLQRAARIVGEAGGSISSTEFAAQWNVVFNASAEMTPEAAATKVAGVLAESGFFLVIDTEDPNVKTFALRPVPQACPHGVRRDQGETCQPCSKIKFIQACAHVLEQGGGKLSSTEFSDKWAQVFPNQPKIPPEVVAKEIAEAMSDSGIFKVTELPEGKKQFEFESDDKIVAYKERLDAEIQAAQAARQAAGGGGATTEGEGATAAAAAPATTAAAAPATTAAAAPTPAGVPAGTGGGAAAPGKVGLGALLD